LIEIRLHGRGGQGAVTASRIIATAAYEEGQYSQAIPMYGTERRGAPLTAFVRLDDQRVRERSLVHDPDISIVLDPLIAKQQAVVDNLKPGGLVILNTAYGPEDVKLGGDFKVATVDATTIALETLGRPITNTAILGAFAKATGLLKTESIEKAIKKYFPGRLGDMNIAAQVHRLQDLLDLLPRDSHTVGRGEEQALDKIRGMQGMRPLRQRVPSRRHRDGESGGIEGCHTK